MCGSIVTRNSDDDTEAALNVVTRFAGAARPRYELARLDFHDFRKDARSARAGGADFRRSDLTYSNLFHTHLVGARFDGATLEGTDFTWACLRGASFAGATSRRGVTFLGADLRGADLSKARFDSMDLSSADLRGAKLERGSPVMAGATTNSCTRLPWRTRVPARCVPR